MKPGPQSSFLVQHISMAPWLPASSVCSFLITVHGKCPLPSPPRPVCDLHSPFPGEAPNHLLHSPLPLALYQLLQDAAESSLSWRCTATLLQEDSLPTLLVLEQGRRTRICPLIPPRLCYTQHCEQTNQTERSSLSHIHYFIYVISSILWRKTHWNGLDSFSNRAIPNQTWSQQDFLHLSQ